MSVNIKSIQFNSLQSGKKVDIRLDPLPDCKEVIDLLTLEKAHLRHWITVGKAFYSQGFHENCCEIFEKARDRASLNYAESDSDQMTLLDSLAAFYVNLSKKEFNKDLRREHIIKATRLYTAADKIIMLDETHLVGRAYLCLYESDKLEQADTQFNFVLDQNPSNVLALIGKARINFIRNEMKLSLTYYKKALEVFPYDISCIRVGIGLCLHKLKKTELAQSAFQRALELDSKCIGAFVGLAIIKLNTKQVDQVQEGMKLISTAYQICPNNSLVLTILADHFFYKNDYTKSERLINFSLQKNPGDCVKAYNMYQMARLYHLKNDFDNSLNYYLQSAQLSPKLYLSLFGLGQLYLQKNDIAQAIKTFEKLLSILPENTEVMKITCICYLKSGNSDHLSKAKEFYNKIIEINPDDEVCWLGLAEASQSDDIKASLEAYNSALKILKTKNTFIKPEILTNVGSLHFRMGNLTYAEKFFEDALTVVQEAIVVEGIVPTIVATIKYNLGKCKEKLCKHLEAVQLYREVIEDFPDYIDSYIQLGISAKRRGDLRESSEWFNQALKIDPENSEAWLHVANLHIYKQEYGPAQKKYERVMLKDGKNIDSYSCLSFANIWLSLLHLSLSDDDKRKRLSERCLNLYRNVLKVDTRNICAANGIGCVLAYNNYLSMARDVFSQCREATAELLDVWVNLAHIYYENKQYTNAIKMYESCYEKFCTLAPNCDILLYIARTYYRCEQLNKAKKILLKVLFHSPSDLVALFNLSLIFQRSSNQMLNNPRISSIEIETAINELDVSQHIFAHLASIQQNKIDRMACERENKASSDLLIQARQISIRVHHQKEADEELIRIHKQKLAEIAKIKEDEDQQLLLQQKAKEEELQHKRLEYLRNTQALLIPITTDSFKSKRTKRKDGDHDLSRSKRKKRKTGDTGEKNDVQDEEFSMEKP